MLSTFQTIKEESHTRHTTEIQLVNEADLNLAEAGVIITAEKEELIRKIMSNTGATRADVESLFETQGLWLNESESEEMIQETQKGFEKWRIGEEML